MIRRIDGRWPLTLLMAMALIMLPAHALAQGKKKPKGGGTPAPGAETPAPGAETPAPGAETPAPGAETPAPGAETPAPGAETPAPRPEMPPTAPPRPAKPVEKPKTGPEPQKAPGPVLPAVKSKYGSVQISGALAARLVMPFRTISSNWQTIKYRTFSGLPENQNVAFELAGAWLKLDGFVGSKNLEYDFRLGYGMHELLLLDVKLTFHLPWVKGLSISAGKFFPEFGLVGHRLFTRLETAEYPIYLTEGGLGVWSQLGISIDYRRKIGPGVIHGAIGVYNGVPDTFTDDNNHKDLFILATYDFTSGPVKGLKAGVNAWIGFPHCIWDSANPALSTCTEEDALKNEADTEMKFGVLLGFKRQFTRWVGANALAEFWFRRYTPWAENRDPWSSIAFWLHAGVPIGKYLEPLVRFEYFKDMTKDATGATDGDNWTWRLTAGLNIYLYKIHSHIKVNYIFQSWGDTFFGSTWIDEEWVGNPLVDPREQATNTHLLLITANTEF